MPGYSEFTEIQEFVEATPPDPILPTMPDEWDGWGDEKDRLRFEKSHSPAMPIGKIAVRGIDKPSSEDDGWGVNPTIKQ